MTDLDKDILAHDGTGDPVGIRRGMVIVQKVLRKDGSLRLPVTPKTHGAVMNVVSSHDHVDGGMELDTGDLSTAHFHHVVDVMDMVVFDDGENAAHTADDTGLLTVVDMAAAHDMVADALLTWRVVK